MSTQKSPAMLGFFVCGAIKNKTLVCKKKVVLKGEVLPQVYISNAGVV